MNKISRNIVLTGMSGCGKTTIGRMIANELGLEFCDMDEYIEEKEGKTIPEIFKNGESAFRELEKAAAIEVSKVRPRVISTGGGVVLNSCNIEALNENGTIFFINRSPEDIVKDVDISSRPMLKSGVDQVFKLYNDRIGLYKRYCDYEILNKGSIETAVREIIEKVRGLL